MADIRRRSTRNYERCVKSFVMVSDKADRSAYCSGCVLVKERVCQGQRGTLLVCSSAFITGRRIRLEVSFFDKVKSNATVVRVHGDFCLLRTAVHKGCEVISLSENVIPSPAFVLTPMSDDTAKCKDAYISTESLEAYLPKDEDVMSIHSTDYCMVSCVTRDISTERLVSAPVFSYSGKTVGLILQSCRARGGGLDAKVILNVHGLKRVLGLLNP